MSNLYDVSKLHYKGSNVAIRNIINICNSYEKIYSNIHAQLIITINSIETWHATWNGTFADKDVSLNGLDVDHRQFLQELSIILALLYKNLNSLLTTSNTPASIYKISKNFDICENVITTDISNVGLINTFEFTDNYCRELKLNHNIGSLNNIGIGFNANIPFDYINDISSNANRFINGRYAYRIGTFATQILQIDLWNETSSRESKIQELFNNTVATGEIGYIDFGTTHKVYINVMKSLNCLIDQLNFSTSNLQNSRSAFSALL